MSGSVYGILVLCFLFWQNFTCMQCPIWIQRILIARSFELTFKTEGGSDWKSPEIPNAEQITSRGLSTIVTYSNFEPLRWALYGLYMWLPVIMYWMQTVPAPLPTQLTKSCSRLLISVPIGISQIKSWMKFKFSVRGSYAMAKALKIREFLTSDTGRVCWILQ